MQKHRIYTRKFIAILFACAYVVFSAFSMIVQCPLPEPFTSLAGLVIGYYFGKSTALEVPKTANEEKTDIQAVCEEEKKNTKV